LIVRIVAIAAALVILAAAGFYVLGPTPQRDKVAATAEDLALGARVYRKNCSSCHGLDGQGQPGWQTSTSEAPPHDATGHTWRHPERSLFRYIKTGVLDDICKTDANPAMPKFKDTLSDDEIRAVLAYIASRWPPQIKALNAAINREYDRQDRLLSGG
jgi:mono/diheme cytochrome c family protein